MIPFYLHDNYDTGKKAVNTELIVKSMGKIASTSVGDRSKCLVWDMTAGNV